MNNVFVLVFLVLCSFAPDGAIAQDQTRSRSKPGLNAQQRLDLAKKLLEPIRAKAVADPNSMERQHYFTKHWAEIDPGWTADFILNNPVPADPKTGGQILYDHSAVLTIMKQINEIEPELGIRLLKAQKSMTSQYAVVALENLEGADELRKKIVEFAGSEIGNQPAGPFIFDSQLTLARLSKDDALMKRVEKSIKEFYESGKAKETFAEIKKNQRVATNLDFYRTLYRRHAPTEFRDDYGPQVESREISPNEIFTLVRNKFQSDQEKVAELNTITSLNYGKQPYEQMNAASAVGLVGTLDHELAFKLAKTAPSPTPLAWAKLMVSPALARHDPQAAQALVRECYDEIAKLDSSDLDRYAYNYAPASVAARGLRVVAHVAPDLLDDCIDQTVTLAKQLKSSRMTRAHDHIFHAVAAIAPYNRKKAEALYDEFSDDIPVHAAAAFFRALLALHPEQVLDEYQEMPEKDARGTDYRIYVRNEILPVLVTKTDDQFWDGLNNQGLGSFDLTILENK